MSDMNILEFNLKIEHLISRGAEAEVLFGQFFNKEVVIKQRIPKAYRIKQIDDLLRKERCIKEVKLLQSARQIGLNVPFVYDIDKENWSIIMEKIDGYPIKLFEDLNKVDYKIIGNYIANLHNENLIHGDLTTSNILIDKTNTIWFIDFGLGFNSTSIEDKAVDILVLKHILESSHPTIYQKAWKQFLGGYAEHFQNFNSIEKRIEVVEQRVRYRSH
ncbi:MAG: KEOPS complex kinase/ATPase Bud32 [Candidatus Heimdallarchaeota archaeon]|nr:KEOPS complex kinase/ATPase Bud32 [Candidatus Heimdallarchaeota archaeon]